jgi:Zn ribbon nucleic-acid-binding protein
MPYKDSRDRATYYRNYELSHRGRFHIYEHNLKIDSLTHYGNGQCACVKCGYSNDLALSIDHINSDGAEHRANKYVGSHFYRWLKTHNYPTGYQTLCMNCQFIKRHTNKEVWNQSPKPTDDRPRLL